MRKTKWLRIGFVAMFFVYITVFVYGGCGKHGGGDGGGTTSGSSAPVLPVDINPPDSSLMVGAVEPPVPSQQPITITYTTSEGNTFDVEVIPGRVGIFFSAGIEENTATQKITANGGTIIGKVPSADFYVVEVATGTEMTFVATMRQDTDVVRADPDFVEKDESRFEPSEWSSWNDNERAYLNKIRAPEAWDLLENTPEMKNSLTDSTKVEVAIIDKGFLNPLDNWDFEGGYDIPDSWNVRYINDLINTGFPVSNVNMGNAHGFLVASICSAKGNNDKKPIGINWYSPITGILSTTFTGRTYKIFDANAKGIEVINISMGAGSTTTATAHKVFYASYATILSTISKQRPNSKFILVKSAGNGGTAMNFTDLNIPDNMIVVGAYTLDQDNSLISPASYSNYGSNVDIYVPVLEKSGWNGFPFFEEDNSTQCYPGTSFAAPVIAGVVSQMWEINPALTPFQIKTILKDSAITHTVGSNTYRILDMYNAIFNIKNLTLPPATNSWTQKIAQDVPPAPSARHYHSMLWDGQRVIMFGGYDGTKKNDLWWYDPVANTWTQKIAQSVAGSPPARYDHSMVWDGSRVIMFGGSEMTNDLWWYDPNTNTWTEKIANGTAGSPPVRRGYAMVYDGTRVIMFGGSSSGLGTNDLWWYNPGTNTWTEKIANGSVNSPSERSSHTMVYDGFRVIMFGGAGNSNNRNDLWWYNSGTNTWTEKIVQGTAGSPSARWYFSMVWDGTRVVMFGGGEGGGTKKNDLWGYDPGLNTWTQKITQDVPGSPSARYYHTMIWDTAKVIMFGGYDGAEKNDLWWYSP
jgi:hypothetical protein